MPKSALIVEQLLPWFWQYGRHNLPWQGKNVYYIWLSEVMLQQTQVDYVIAYFKRFIKHFPTIADLAAAEEDKVMRYWAGLGYYARARHLQQSAKIIVAKYQGIFPNRFCEVIKLPGIGRTTAGAILALGFDKNYPILDGNVKRVLSRYHHIDTPINHTQTLKKLWHYAKYHTPKQQAAAYTQAIMDLGATVCVSSEPRCQYCPLLQNCLAFKKQKQRQLPLRLAAKTKPIKTTYMLAVIKAKRQILLQKRLNAGIWGGLWSLPESAFIEDNAMNINFKNVQQLRTFRHSFTHYHLDITPIIIKAHRIEKQEFAIKEVFKDSKWFVLDDIKVGVPRPVQKILSKIVKDALD